MYVQQRVMLLESWLDFEKNFGDTSSIKQVADKLPRRIKKRRELKGTHHTYYHYAYYHTISIIRHFTSYMTWYVYVVMTIKVMMDRMLDGKNIMITYSPIKSRVVPISSYWKWHANGRNNEWPLKEMMNKSISRFYAYHCSESVHLLYYLQHPCLRFMVRGCSLLKKTKDARVMR
jgi:hypothetical protein